MKKDLHQKVSIIILNWNGKQDTLECLKSVLQLEYANFEVIVVDNGSSDDSVEAISAAYPDILVLETGTNLGYAGGNNVGIRQAMEHHADYILVLNNDTTVASDLLSAFINAVDTLPEGSILGAKIYYFDKPDVLWFAGGELRSYAQGFKHIGLNQIDSEEFNQCRKVDYITGCALFAEANTFNEVGLLDEDFFLTYEETDWCYRAKTYGFDCFVIPSAKLWHKVSSSFGGGDSPIIKYFLARNKPLWAQRNQVETSAFQFHKENLLAMLRLFTPSFELVEGDHSLVKKLYWLILGWVNHLKETGILNVNKQATLMGLRDYYLGRVGDCPQSVRLLKSKK